MLEKFVTSWSALCLYLITFAFTSNNATVYIGTNFTRNGSATRNIISLICRMSFKGSTGSNWKWCTRVAMTAFNSIIANRWPVLHKFLLSCFIYNKIMTSFTNYRCSSAVLHWMVYKRKDDVFAPGLVKIYLDRTPPDLANS